MDPQLQLTIGVNTMLITEQFWWFLTRSSSLIAWALMSISVIWGILLSTRIFRKFDNPGWLQDLHRFVSTLSYVFVGLHLFSLYMDSWIQFEVIDFLIPFRSQYVRSDVAVLAGLPTALGVFALYLMSLILVTSWLMRRIPRKFWKFIHLQSYLTILFVSLHAGWTGSDTNSELYKYFSMFLIGITTLAVLIRIFFPKSHTALSNRVEKRPHFSENMQTARVTAVALIATDVMEVRLKPTAQIEPWTAGSHISIALPNGMTRQYSLAGSPTDSFYTIAVHLHPKSRGGSEYIHNKLRVNQELLISEPKNHFKLEPAERYQFVAGGIGITPIKTMLEALGPGANWKLLYLGRDMESMAYLPELLAKYGDQVELHLANASTDFYDFDRLDIDKQTLVYVCASPGVVNSVQDSVPPKQFRVEKFVADVKTSGNADNEFSIACTKSGKTVKVGANETALEALEQANVKVYASCRTGVCGSCEMKVKGGSADHRDSIYPEHARETQDKFYPCVSRANSEQIELEV